MEKAVELHRKIAPELVEAVEDRYSILRHIHYAQPIGRRVLAADLGLAERGVRTHIDFLKTAGLIDFSPLGMAVTGEGEAVLEDLAEYVRSLHGLATLENELAKRLGIRKVVIIRGDVSADPIVRRELGRAAAGVLSEHLGDNMTIAVSGGSTMAWVAEAVAFTRPETTVLPARGGLGEKVEYQANTIAAVIATKLGGRYRLLHVPDGVSEEALDVLLAHDANLRALAQMIRQADLLLHGIGQAEAMARRRGLSPSFIEQMRAAGMVGEALGHYCTLAGKVINDTSSIGLKMDELTGLKHVIAVAGGREKAAAIIAVAAAGSRDVLVTDEAAARAIQDILNKKN